MTFTRASVPSVGQWSAASVWGRLIAVEKSIGAGPPTFFPETFRSGNVGDSESPGLQTRGERGPTAGSQWSGDPELVFVRSQDAGAHQASKRLAGKPRFFKEVSGICHTFRGLADFEHPKGSIE